MDATGLLKLIIIGLFAATIEAQSRPYAKFGSSGETIGLFQLMEEPRECRHWSTVIGGVVMARANVAEKGVVYRFTVRSSSLKYEFVFALEKDASPSRDVQDLLASKRPLRVRACRDHVVWTVDEIARVK